MTKVDIVERICEKIDFPKREGAKVVEYVFDIMKETLQRESKLMISGFGNFLIRNKKARRGRNPQTGGDIEIAPRRILTFKPNPAFRAKVNGSGDQ